MKNKRGWIRIVEPKRHPLVSFELPQSSARQHLSIASDGCCGLQQGDRK
ncbi:hypothetical protein HN832_01585 [archaeon]|nr:hypothetical protein [archaeon]MBT4373924.1 hypothetical protein [archaeon]MBT4532317.1 hypothetical protein [archaeon]MBT7001903.1 hypothetical protein [archaeon]MBT7282084.1 hypothetical protein [archaeon]